jgi:polyisoprenyl-phosphate glycosyltransferase
MISIVIPIFNEQENLPELRRRLTAAMDSTGEAWEAILVDDGSRDASPKLLMEAHSAGCAVQDRHALAKFRASAGRLRGHSQCHGRQRGSHRWRSSRSSGSDPATGRQVERGIRGGFGRATQPGGEGRSRRGISRVLSIAAASISDLPNAPSAGIFGLMDRKVIDVFNRMPERSRFIPGLRNWLGFRQASVSYDRAERAAGKPKQTLGRLIHYAADGMVSFSNKPLRAATWLGFFVSIFAFLLAIFYIVTFFVFRKQITGFTTEIVCILFLGGVQLVSVGILGEYIGRIYEEVKQRPLYVMRKAYRV